MEAEENWVINQRKITNHVTSVFMQVPRSDDQPFTDVEEHPGL
jgi:hypothetical protein